MGTDVRVNPDYAKNPKAGKLEEDVLGMMLVKNEYITRPVDGKALEEEDFFTSLGKRLFSFVKEHTAENGFNPGILNEDFTQDEVSRVFGMIARRNELKMSDEITFDTYVRALREAKKKTTAKCPLKTSLPKKETA